LINTHAVKTVIATATVNNMFSTWIITHEEIRIIDLSQSEVFIIIILLKKILWGSK